MTEHSSTDQIGDQFDGTPPFGAVDPDRPQQAPVADGEPATAPEPVTEPAPPPSLEVLAAAVETLRDALAASTRTQEHQQLLLDKLHDEKERLREAEQRRQRDPILRELIQLSDTCVRTSRQWSARRDVSAETTERVSAVLLDVAADVALIIERQGIEEFAPENEEKFVRTEAKAVGTRPTTDVARDGLVAEVRKPGYRMGERILRFSEVVVWRVEHAAAAAGEPR